MHYTSTENQIKQRKEFGLLIITCIKMIKIKRNIVYIRSPAPVSALQIIKVDQKDEKNRPLHNTIKFISKQLIVRRGQTFFIDVHLTRPYKPEEDNFFISLQTGNKPREFDKSFVHIPKVEEFDALNQKWAYKVTGMKENILNLEVNCPMDALPAKYEIAFEDDDDILYQHPNSLFILFNPWNKGMY